MVLGFATFRSLWGFRVLMRIGIRFPFRGPEEILALQRTGSEQGVWEYFI